MPGKSKGSEGAKHPAQVIPRGAVIRKQDGRAEVVRYVSTVIHYADGTQEVFGPGDEVELLPIEEATPAAEQLRDMQQSAMSAASVLLNERERAEAQNK
jgi:hypothetical protein